MVPRTASHFSSHDHILFFNCCSELVSQPSWVTRCPSASPRTSTSRSLATLGGFQPSRKMEFLANRRGGWWDRQNDSLLITRRYNHQWKGVLARGACSLLAKTPSRAITDVELLGKLHQAPSFVLDGLDKASSLGRRKLDCWSVGSCMGLFQCCILPGGS